MISHKHASIFVHIPKTAGRSLCQGLFNRSRGVHMTAQNFRNLDPSSFDSYFKFSIVRNPWDRLVSFYTMCKSSTALSHRRLMKLCTDMYGTTVFENFLNLTAYILGKETPILSELGFESALELHPQYYWLYEGDNLLVDYVGRFETLLYSYNELCTHLDLPDKINRLPRIGASSGRGLYKNSFNSSTRDLVSDLYAVDCKTFGYSFDD